MYDSLPATIPVPPRRRRERTSVWDMLNPFAWVELKPHQAMLVVVVFWTVIRLIVLMLNDLNLGPDEAQYWSWSKDFAFGYFSKPPMIAWTIGLTTGLCGDSEACIRLSSPLFHAGTAMVLYLVGAVLFGPRTGFWASAIYITLPAVSFSSGIVSTDVPLLFFWSLALLSLWQTIELRATGWAVMTGVAIGLGLLSKYAMVYFLGGMAIMMVLDRTARQALLSRHGAIIAGLSALFLAPNIIWNISNDFATFSHTAANANWSSELFNLENLFKFVGDQFGVFGPILFGALLWGLFTLRRRFRMRGAHGRAFVYLLAMALPALTIVTLQAFISRANANWAATAYPAATVLVCAWLLQAGAKGWLKGSYFLHVFGGLAFYALVLSPDLVAQTGLGNAFKRVRAWDEIGRTVNTMAVNGHFGRPFTSVLVNDRLVYGEMLYYARPLPVPLAMWDSNDVPENHFELNNPLTVDLGERTLFVTRSKKPEKILAQFSRVTPIWRMTSDIGGGRERTFDFYVLEGYRP